MTIYEKLAAVQQELKAPKDKFNKFGGYSYRSAEGILEAVKPALKKYNAAITLSDEIVEVGGRIYVKATAIFYDTEKLYMIKAEIKTVPSDTVPAIYHINADNGDIIPPYKAEEYGPISVTAYAREAEDKKGLDVSQITGTASSYARKYALNGLLLIDDTKDADTDEYHEQTNPKGTPATKRTHTISTTPAVVPEATRATRNTAASETTYELADNNMSPDAIITSEIVDAIRGMAQQASVDLNAVMVKPLEQLTIKQAGALMTSLKRRIGV